MCSFAKYATGRGHDYRRLDVVNDVVPDLMHLVHNLKKMIAKLVKKIERKLTNPDSDVVAMYENLKSDPKKLNKANKMYQSLEGPDKWFSAKKKPFPQTEQDLPRREKENFVNGHRFDAYDSQVISKCGENVGPY